MSDEKLDLILADTQRIKAALWPDEGQPGVLTRHAERMDEIDKSIDSLVSWRNYLSGAWVVIVTYLSIRFGTHRGS